jgi:tripartite-type tricarboxylate transporter receptor subunit TctC
MKGRLIPTIISGILSLSVFLTGCSAGTTKVTDIAGKEVKEQYPTKQIEYIVAYAAGGITDIVARAAADYLSKEWGKPVLVVNKTGGAGAVGGQAALKDGGKDGYTVLADAVSMSTLLNAGMSDPPIKLEDRIFVSRLVKDPIVFIVKLDAPWKDMKEFSQWAKTNPDQLTWTGTGPSALSAFGIAEWLQVIGGDFKKSRMIPTTGGADSIPKVAGGNAVLAVQNVSEAMPLLKAGKVKILGVVSPKRSPFIPDVPTLEEQGITGLTTTYWTGVSLPAGTPDYVVKKWEESTERMVKDSAFLDKLKNLNVEASYMNSADFNKFIKDDTARFTDIAIKVGIRK